MKKFVHEYDKLVFGGSLSALVYAYHEQLPIVWIEPKQPYFFDKTKDGKSKQLIWQKMAFLLSLSGLAPMADKGRNFRLDGDTLKVYGERPYFVAFKFKELIRFDNADDEKEDTVYEVLDWVNVRSGARHDHDYLGSTDDFVRHIYFYQTERVDGNQRFKDLVAISYMNQEQLRDVDYSETYIRFKVLDMMTEAGIRGTKNGKDKKGKQKYLSLNVEPAHREVRIPDFKQEDDLIEKYKDTRPTGELAVWTDLLGGAYEGH